MKPIAFIMFLIPASLSHGAALFVDDGSGRLVGDAIEYSNITVAGTGVEWVEVTSSTSEGGPHTNSRTGSFMQLGPDNGGAGAGPGNPPGLQFNLQITTPGTYRLFSRWDGSLLNTGASDSMFVRIVEQSDGAGGAIADWYELAHGVDANFGTESWDSTGGFEANTANPGDAFFIEWTLTAGTYTLEYNEREDGAVLDAWVFQLNSLAAPTGNGPASTAIPEPSAALLGFGSLALLLRRRRS